MSTSKVSTKIQLKTSTSSLKLKILIQTWFSIISLKLQLQISTSNPNFNFKLQIQTSNLNVNFGQTRSQASYAHMVGVLTLSPYYYEIVSADERPLWISNNHDSKEEMSMLGCPKISNSYLNNKNVMCYKE